MLLEVERRDVARCARPRHSPSAACSSNTTRCGCASGAADGGWRQRYEELHPAPRPQWSSDGPVRARRSPQPAQASARARPQSPATRPRPGSRPAAARGPRSTSASRPTCGCSLVAHHLVDRRRLLAHSARGPGRRRPRRGTAAATAAGRGRRRSSDWARPPGRVRGARRLRMHEIAYWLARRRTPAPVLPPPGRRDEPVQDAAGSWSSASTGEARRRLLREVPSGRTACRSTKSCSPHWSRLVSHWFGERRLLVNLEGHGREELARRRSTCRGRWAGSPRSSRSLARSDRGRGLRAAAAQVRQGAAAPRPAARPRLRLLRYLGPGRQLAPALLMPEVCFNYLGQFDDVLSADSPFRLARESAGAVREPAPAAEPPARDRRLGGRGTLAGAMHPWPGNGLPDDVRALAERFVLALHGDRRTLQRARRRRLHGLRFPARRPRRGRARPPPRRAPHRGRLSPLPLQMGLLFHSIDAPGSGVYFRQLSCVAPGRSRRSRPSVAPPRRPCERHPILRTAFAWQGLREPLQLVLRDGRAPHCGPRLARLSPPANGSERVRRVPADGSRARLRPGRPRP